MEYQIEYIPTALDLTERAFAIAKSEYLIHVHAASTASMNSEGVFDSSMTLMAYFRKPGQPKVDPITDMNAGSVALVMGDLAKDEELFDQFREKVAAILGASQSKAA